MSGRTAAYLAHLLNFLLLIALWGFSAWAYDGLPDRIPVHFNAAGVPDRIAEKTYWTWMMVPFSALGMTILIYASALLVPLARRWPWIVNLPGSLKRRFLAMTPAEREPILEIIAALVFWMTVPTNGLMLWIQVGIHRAVLEGRMSGGMTGMILFLVAFGAILAWLLVWLMREMRRA